jgi:hypothetical protein
VTPVGPPGTTSPGGPAPRRGSHRERGHDLPVFQDQPTHLLQLAPALRSRGHRRAAGPLQAAADQPERHPRRGGGEDPMPGGAGQGRSLPGSTRVTEQSCMIILAAQCAAGWPETGAAEASAGGRWCLPGPGPASVMPILVRWSLQHRPLRRNSTPGMPA